LGAGFGLQPLHHGKRLVVPVFLRVQLGDDAHHLVVVIVLEAIGLQGALEIVQRLGIVLPDQDGARDAGSHRLLVAVGLFVGDDLVGQDLGLCDVLRLVGIGQLVEARAAGTRWPRLGFLARRLGITLLRGFGAAALGALGTPL